jgi:hypothetical protein
VTDVAIGIAIVAGVAAVVVLFTDVGASKPTASNAAKRSPLILRW